jgi:PAS domain S-box-containing protein
LIGVDECYLVNRWNKSAEEMFGVESSVALGRPFSDLDLEWVRPNAAAQFFTNYSADGTATKTVKLFKNGSTQVLDIATYPVTGNGVHRGYLCIGKDITKPCQLEE